MGSHLIILYTPDNELVSTGTAAQAAERVLPLRL